MNIGIVNLETKNIYKALNESVSVTDFNSTKEIKLAFTNDKLNFHDNEIFVLCNDGHYNIIYKSKNQIEFDKFLKHSVFYQLEAEDLSTFSS